MNLYTNIFLSCFLATLLSSCSWSKKTNEETASSSWSEYSRLQDSLLSEFTLAYRDFEIEVGTTARRFMTNPEPGLAREQQLNQYLSGVELAMEEHEGSMAMLRDHLSEIQAGQEHMRGQIQRMREDVSDKNERLDSLEVQTEEVGFEEETLERRLKTLRQSVAELDELNQSQREHLMAQETEIAQKWETFRGQIEELNRVYVATGSEEELIDQGFLQRRSGVFKLFGGLEVNPNWREAHGSERDRRYFRSLKWNGKKIKLITQHPDDSYQMVEDDGELTLKIVDAEEFWQQTRLLVVITD